MKEQIKFAAPNEIDIEFSKIYISLKKGIKYLVIAPLLLGLLATFYILILAKPIYTSEAKILLAGNENNQSSLMGLASQFGVSIPSNASDVQYLSSDNLPEILKSRTLTNSILFSEFKLSEIDYPTTYFTILFDSAEVIKSDSSTLIDLGINYIKEKVINVKQVKATNIFDISANSPDPVLSAQIANAIIFELDKLQLKFSKSELRHQKEFIIDRVNEVKNELFMAETRLKIFLEQNLQINLSPSLILDQERLKREIEIQTQIYISLKQQLEQVKIEENKNDKFLKIIDKPNIPVKPSKPRKILIISISYLIGLIITGLIVTIKNY